MFLKKIKNTYKTSHFIPKVWLHEVPQEHGRLTL